MFSGLNLRRIFLPRILILLVTLCSFSTAAAARQAALNADRTGPLQRAIAAREYNATTTAYGLQAPNRAQNIRTYFRTGGIEMVDRTAAGSPVLARVAFKGLGRGSTPAGEQEATQLVHRKNRVEIHRPGVLEWYENTPAGLEQGFTLSKRPAGKGPLRLTLSVSRATVRECSGGMILTATNGRSLHYGKLAVTDATGRTLPARMAAPTKAAIVLTVEDRGAVYPIVIDPILTATADARLESDQGGALMGTSVSTAGDVNGDGYGDVIVGAYNYDNGQSGEGAAFVFLGSAAGIADGSPATAHAILQSDQTAAMMGMSVSTAGDVNGDGYADVIVGACFFTDGQSNEGAAFVFLGSAAGIADGTPATAHAILQSDQVGAYMGYSVSTAGDVNGDGYADVIVGACDYENGQSDEGAAFVFVGSAAGIADGTPATAHAILQSDQISAYMGFSVSTAGDVNGDGYADVIIGSGHYDNGQSNEGAAFVFVGSAAGIADGSPATAHAILQSDQDSASMGYSVSAAGDVNGDGYGDVIVGANRYSNGQSFEGAAFVFLGSAAGIADGSPATAHAILQSDQTSASMGTSVSTAGDVNGDGYGDVIVGADFYDDGQSDEGGAFIFVGSAAGIADGSPVTAHAILQSDQAEASMGHCVSTAGDVNGDGYDDVIVGAFTYDNGQSDEGTAFIYLGTPPPASSGSKRGGGGSGGGCFIQDLIDSRTDP